MEPQAENGKGYEQLLDDLCERAAPGGESFDGVMRVDDKFPRDEILANLRKSTLDVPVEGEVGG